jgi:hypothetical protein
VRVAIQSRDRLFRSVAALPEFLERKHYAVDSAANGHEGLSRGDAPIAAAY